MAARDLTEMLASKGRSSFVSKEACEALKVSPEAGRQALYRLTKQGRIASPARGFYVIVPPEYRSLGCLPAEQFIPDLMRQKGLVYYAGLLTAAQYYGAAHQRPQEFQVFLQKNHRPIRCGKVKVKFIAKKNINKVPTRKRNTPCGELRISTPEVTAIDLAGYPQHVGGYNHVATVLAELSDEIDPAALAEVATTAPVAWTQRLGYLLELVGATDILTEIRKYVHENAREYINLIPGKTDAGDPRLGDWKLIMNDRPEPDT